MKITTTIKDIALKAGVSTATVSRHLNNTGYVSKKLEERISAVIKELDYVPNHVAISLKTTSTQIIGIVTPELSNVSFMDTVKAISEVAMKNGYQPIILSSNEDEEKESKILDVLISQRVDGIIIASAGSDGEKILRINEQRLPVVLFDRDVCNKDGEVLLDAVVNDNFNGAYQMVNYLISLGHRDIAILASSKNQPQLNMRLNGYLQVLQNNQIPINPDYVLKSDLDFKSGYEGCKELMSMGARRPTAVFALNNTAALGAESALNELHIQIPQEISICGFGEFKYHSVLTPDLTVVNQSPYELGKKSAEILMKKMHNQTDWKPQKVVLPANILLHNSCAPPHSCPKA